MSEVVPILLAFPLVAIVMLLVWRFERSFRGERKFRKLLQERECLDDEGFRRRFFATGVLPADVPGRVRRVYAEVFGYPAEKLRPEDDFQFLLKGDDPTPLIQALEMEFGVSLPPDQWNERDTTINSVAWYVTRRLEESRGQPGGGA
jgi:acyl carrier protein